MESFLDRRSVVAIPAKLVTRAEDWKWSSLWRREQGDSKLTAWLSAWPVDRPRDWVRRVNRAESLSELKALRLSVDKKRGQATFLIVSPASPAASVLIPAPRLLQFSPATLPHSRSR